MSLWCAALLLAGPSLGPGPLRPEQCGSCHPSEYQAWAESGHRRAVENAIFQRGYRRDPAPRCLACHATASEAPSEGVSCLGCHRAPHEEPIEGLGAPGFCARCHQFRFEGVETLAQRTFQEWAQFHLRGGKGTCQSCHMPNGSHAIAGAHEVRELQNAIGISFHRAGEALEVALTNRLAGHDVPTGDLFRVIRVEMRKQGSSEFTVAAEIGRNGSFVGVDGVPQLKWKNDNALHPGETRVVKLTGEPVEQVRVVYFYEAKLDPSAEPERAVLAEWAR